MSSYLQPSPQRRKTGAIQKKSTTAANDEARSRRFARIDRTKRRRDLTAAEKLAAEQLARYPADELGRRKVYTATWAEHVGMSVRQMHRIKVSLRAKRVIDFTDNKGGLSKAATYTLIENPDNVVRRNQQPN